MAAQDLKDPKKAYLELADQPLPVASNPQVGIYFLGAVAGGKKINYSRIQD
jgi:hypothetical protein